MNPATAVPKIKLMRSTRGSCAVVLRQPDDLHGRALASAGEQVGDQLPLTFLEPTKGGALLMVAFQASEVDVPSEAMIGAHCDQVNARSVFLPSTSHGGQCH